jgi:hypothetical protein
VATSTGRNPGMWFGRHDEYEHAAKETTAENP